MNLLWLRQDLRLDDHPALLAALARGGPVLPVYVWAPGAEGDWPPGGASRWWLHRSLTALAAELRARGSDLIVRAGDPAAALDDLARECGATALFWSGRCEPAAREAEARVATRCAARGLELRRLPGATLYEPEAIRTGQGGAYQVFTPFWKACLRAGPPSSPREAPARLPAPAAWPASLPLDALGLLPRRDWAGGLAGAWRPGEAGARALLARALADQLAAYPVDRDRPDREGTSRLSPHLHWGEISPRRVWAAVAGQVAAADDPRVARGAEALLRQLGWREFAHHLLRHFPHTDSAPLRGEFAALPWRDDDAGLRAWQRGRTGYPLVDAGLRELWATGWMHNRVRMVAASFLVKHLLLPWQTGARWFWDTLVDADLANNSLGWQWTAGCGADAAPFFRIFNPVLQGRRFDPDGAYVRRWVPELAALPAAHLHEPWRAPAAVLAAAGVRPGVTYPRPLVDHAAARQRALAALAALPRAPRGRSPLAP